MKNKGQISQTINWVVATIIIIAIILISIFLANSGLFDRQKELKDQQKDFIATKSIVDFLSYDDNLELLSQNVGEGNYTSFEERLKPVLEQLTFDSKGIWSLDLDIDDGSLHRSIVIAGYAKTNQRHDINIVFYIDNQKLKFHFVKEDILEI